MDPGKTAGSLSSHGSRFSSVCDFSFLRMHLVWIFIGILVKFLLSSTTLFFLFFISKFWDLFQAAVMAATINGQDNPLLDSTTLNPCLPAIRKHRALVHMPQLFVTSLVTTETEKQSIRGYFQVLLESPSPIIKQCVNCPKALFKENTHLCLPFPEMGKNQH